jgi:hypothetical protein
MSGERAKAIQVNNPVEIHNTLFFAREYKVAAIISVLSQ